MRSTCVNRSASRQVKGLVVRVPGGGDYGEGAGTVASSDEATRLRDCVLVPRTTSIVVFLVRRRTPASLDQRAYSSVLGTLDGRSSACGVLSSGARVLRNGKWRCR